MLFCHTVLVYVWHNVLWVLSVRQQRCKSTAAPISIACVLQDGWSQPLPEPALLCTAPLASHISNALSCSLWVLFAQVLALPVPPAARMVFRKPPDGGWGWVIVAVSFFTQFLCYGSPLAVGVLYLEWLDAFGEGKGKTAWVGSLANGIGLLASKCRSSICLKLKHFQLILSSVCTIPLLGIVSKIAANEGAAFLV